MYSSIHISGYRALTDFTLHDLGRINLLVGTNNSGKTSVLECIELLHTAGANRTLLSILERRGEWLESDGGDRVYDIQHLFSEQDIDLEIRLSGDFVSQDRGLPSNPETLFSVGFHDRRNDDEPLDETERLALSVLSSIPERKSHLELTSEGLLPRRSLRYPPVRNPDDLPTVQFIGTDGLTSQQVARTFSDVLLTDAKDDVVAALQLIEPSVDRIAPVAYPRGIPGAFDSRGGIYLKLRTLERRMPIGSFGDGMWRMLGLALALANARGGVLLVDEIDTGLHYTVMEKMWRMICDRAEALSVQVFATTHSKDCYDSLAETASSDEAHSKSITIQRIEAGRSSAVSFSGHELDAVAERGLEVR